MSGRVYYGILNTDLNRMLTSASGNSIWEQKQDAEDAMNGEFGGGSHLELVNVVRYKDAVEN